MLTFPSPRFRPCSRNRSRERYLKRHILDFIMFVWGERRADYLASEGREDARTAEGRFDVNDVLHKQGFIYQGGSFERFL